MELSLFGRPDWGGNKICINHLFETSEDLAWFVKWSSYGVSKRREIFQNIFEIFSIIVSNSKSHTGRCHMIYWCFLIVCLLSFHWKLAPCEHFICRHSQKLQCTPSNIPDSEYWTFQLTSHGQMFLIFFMQIHCSALIMEKFWKVDMAISRVFFQRILSDLQKTLNIETVWYPMSIFTVAICDVLGKFSLILFAFDLVVKSLGFVILKENNVFV